MPRVFVADDEDVLVLFQSNLPPVAVRAMDFQVELDEVDIEVEIDDMTIEVEIKP